MIVFPEGTSTDGRAVLPFKSSLFAVFCGTPNLVIRPVSLILEAVDGAAVAGHEGARDGYAWYGEMALPPHLWAFARGRGARLRADFPPAGGGMRRPQSPRPEMPGSGRRRVTGVGPLADPGLKHFTEGVAFVLIAKVTTILEDGERAMRQTGV